MYEEGETQVSSSNEDDLEEDNESSVEVISGSEISEGDDSDHNDNTNVHGMTYNSSRNAKSVQQSQSKDKSESEASILSHDQENIQATLNPIIKMISHFLFLQLKFRIPDRAIYYILVFLKGLLSTLLLLIPGNELLSKLHESFPNTLYGWIKEIIKTTWKSSISAYVVCTKCCTLTKLSSYTFPVRRQTHSDISKCSFIEFPNHHQVSRRQKCNCPLFKQIY